MKVSIHPLFFAVIILCGIFGGLPSTLICLVTALLHECGHVFYAYRAGYTCEKIKIMPYGAAAVCDIEGISIKDEIKLALAGPLVNAAICVVIVALWWFFPQTYAYTDTVLYANLAMLIINLLPAYSLDGGRVAGCILTKLFNKRVAKITMRVSAAVCSATLVLLFVFVRRNPTLIAFAACLLISSIEKAPRAELINFSSQKRARHGVEVKYVLCDYSLTFRQAFKLLDERRYLVLQLYDGGIADEITQDELYELATCRGYYDRVFGEDLSRNERENISLESLPSATACTHSQPKETASSTAPESERKL